MQCYKMAPSLSKKVLFPTNIERQKVDICMKLFDEKNIAVLKCYGSKINNVILLRPKEIIKMYKLKPNVLLIVQIFSCC